MHRVTPALALLRAAGIGALVLLLWNPSHSRPLPPGEQPIVLLDASLSMDAPPGGTGPWRAALDSARRLATGSDAVIWRFGADVAAFDSGPPASGATRLGPALEAAAGRRGAVIVVTDGVVDDVAAIAPDLRRRPRVIVTPRPPFFDAFVAGVDAQRYVTRADTLRLRVRYGTAGMRGPGHGTRTGTIAVGLGGRRLASRSVALPDSGIVSAEVSVPVSRLPAGSSVLDIRLEGVPDAEPRDDARQFVVTVSPEPAAVILASPPGWEAQFLARTLSDVARVPVKTFVETEPGRWRDAETLAPVPAAERARVVQGARLVVLSGAGSAARMPRLDAGAALLLWPGEGQAGDWYVDAPPPPGSPLAAALAGIVWDSLPPASSALVAPRESLAVTALTARLARRGPPRPIVTLAPERPGAPRRVMVTASGLWRWAFRGGAAAEAYRSLVAGMVDWLLGEQGAGSRERAVPVAPETANGLPLVWQWTGSGEPQSLAITLERPQGVRSDTLRFDAAGRAELRLPPGVYRYALAGGAGRGVVVVEDYSDEWRPRAPTLAAQPGAPQGRFASVGLRDRWWLFVIAIAAFAAEWTWRRRQGLP